MNKREISELSRRLKPEKANIGRIYGCYVNSNKEIIAYLDESVALLPQEESRQYLALLKKVLSGSLSRNLTDIIFSTEQVADSENHRLLMALREDRTDARRAFFEKVTDHLDMGDDNYLILCANDAYDVPYHSHSDVDRSAQDFASGESDQVFRYFLCAVCPVKDGKPELGYFPGENEFHHFLARQIVGNPELGFLFPAFDNRATNIYNALFYSRKPDEVHYEFIEGIFQTDLSMTPAEQREAFEAVLNDSVDCRLDVIRAVHEQLTARVAEHAESREEEPLTVSCREICTILADCGIQEDQLTSFRKGYEDRFGKTVLNPENIVDIRHFQVKAGEVTITVSPEQSFLIETREMDGRKYIMVPADGGAELNGFAVRV
ncbi:MAG: DUF4317 domain-containing protein [Oscillospiraceae bacterium]|nr:DUF4317 domain-containing protein [Oscillospiraceae bacterium]